MIKKILSEPNTGSFSRAGAVSISISIGVAFATYLSLAIIANRFGGSIGCDVYFYLVSLTTVSSALISGVFSAVFLPTLIKLRVRDGLDEASRFISCIFTWCLIICLVISQTSYVFNYDFFALASKFQRDVIQSQHDIFSCFGPAFFFATLCELFRLVLIAFGRYATAAISALFQPLSLVLMLIVSGDDLKESSMALLFWGSRAGALLFLLAYIKRLDIKLCIMFSGNASASKFIKVSTPYALAGLITHFSIFFVDFMASGLGTGVLTSVNYAQRIYALPLALGVTPLLDIARARFAEFHAHGDIFSFNKQYNNLVKIIAYYSIPISVIFFVFSNEIVTLLFYRGAFSSDQVNLAASCLQVLALSIPFSCFFTLNGRSVESFQQLLWPSIFGSIGNVIFVLALFFMVDWFGYLGIPLARLVLDFLYFLPMGVVFVIFFGVGIDFKFLLKSVFFASSSCLIPVIIYWSDNFRFLEQLGLAKAWDDLISMAIFFILSLAFLLVVDPSLRRALFSGRNL